MSGGVHRAAVVVAGIASGLTNQEIAERMYVRSTPSKSYIRSAYRKIGVERRPETVLWAVEDGFRHDTFRTLDPALRVRPTGRQSVLVDAAALRSARMVR